MCGYLVCFTNINFEVVVHYRINSEFELFQLAVFDDGVNSFPHFVLLPQLVHFISWTRLKSHTSVLASRHLETASCFLRATNSRFFCINSQPNCLTYCALLLWASRDKIRVCLVRCSVPGAQEGVEAWWSNPPSWTWLGPRKLTNCRSLSPSRPSVHIWFTIRNVLTYA